MLKCSIFADNTMNYLHIFESWDRMLCQCHAPSWIPLYSFKLPQIMQLFALAMLNMSSNSKQMHEFCRERDSPKFTPSTLPEWKLCVPVAPLYFIAVSEELGIEAYWNLWGMQHNLACFLCSDECSDVAMEGDIPCLSDNQQWSDEACWQPALRQSLVIARQPLWTMRLSLFGWWGSPMISITIPLIFYRFFFDCPEWIPECK